MLTAPFLYSVPFVLTLAPTLLVGVAKAMRKEEEPHNPPAEEEEAS
jgi:hypothetical protein